MSTETQQQTTAATKATAKFQEGTVDSILKKVSSFQESGELVLPPNYIPENAVRAAWLVLQETTDRNDRPALEVCTKESIATAFLEMVTKGLSVVKKQCYFVVYGNKLVLEDSYIGKITIAKRDANVKEVNGVTVYEGDEFEYEVDAASGRKKVLRHKQSLGNINIDKILGAYAIVTYNDGTTDCEIMSLSQIQKAWAQGGSKGNSPAHKNFADQMAEKTVINRALKIEVGSADDSAIKPRIDGAAENVRQEIKHSANAKDFDFDDAEILEDEPKSGIQPSVDFEKQQESAAETTAESQTERKASF